MSVLQADISVPANFKSHARKPFVVAKGSMVEEEVAETPPLKFALMTKRGEGTRARAFVCTKAISARSRLKGFLAN